MVLQGGGSSNENYNQFKKYTSMFSRYQLTTSRVSPCASFVLYPARFLCALKQNRAQSRLFICEINVNKSASIEIIVITSREPHDQDYKTSQFSLHFTSLIRANLRLSRPLSSVQAQLNETIFFQQVLGLKKPNFNFNFKKCLHLPI